MLASHIAQVCAGVRRVARGSVCIGRLSGAGARAVAAPAEQHSHGASQRVNGGHLEFLYEARLVGLGARHHEGSELSVVRGLRHRKRAPAGLDLAAKRELAEQHVRVQAGAWHLSAGGQHGACKREVEPGARLRHIRGGEARGDSARREFIAGVADRRAHPLARLAHRRIGQPDDHERGQARADIDLDGHPLHLQRLDRERMGSG
jgi:hypothetical protein